MTFRANPLISIIIPVYNRECFVIKTLENIVSNNYRPIELILVNDGSNDKTLDILQKFKTRNETESFKIIVLDQTNAGAPTARNFGYGAAKGEYIQFLDSDDFIDPEKFNLQILKMRTEDADFGLCDVKMIFTDEDNREEYMSNSRGLKKVIHSKGSFGCGAPLLRRDLTNKLSWYIGLSRNQDVDYFLRAALLSKKIAYVNQDLYTYIHHTNGRISDVYLKSKPVYKVRIISLIKTFRFGRNWHYITFSILSLTVALFKFYLKKSYLLIGKKVFKKKRKLNTPYYNELSRHTSCYSNIGKPVDS